MPTDTIHCLPIGGGAVYGHGRCVSWATGVDDDGCPVPEGSYLHEDCPALDPASVPPDELCEGCGGRLHESAPWSCEVCASTLDADERAWSRLSTVNRCHAHQSRGAE